MSDEDRGFPPRRRRYRSRSRSRPRPRSRSSSLDQRQISHEDNGRRRRERSRSEDWNRDRDRDRRKRDRSRSRSGERPQQKKRRSLSRESDYDRRRRRDRRRDRDRDRHDRDGAEVDDYDRISRSDHKAYRRKSPPSRAPSWSPSRSRSRSRSAPRRNRDSPPPFRRAKVPLPSQQDAFGKGDGRDDDHNRPRRSAVIKPDAAAVEKQKPNFATTGRLAAASNTVQAGGGAGQAIVLKYHEPPEARKPSARDAWRMYVFKGADILATLELATQSCWLFGREAAVADFPLDHPSCSKQHAVVQFRYVERRNEYGDRVGKVKPYVIDLESANGTTVNDDPVPPRRFVELRDKDVLKFGHSSREYVLQLPPAG